MVHRNWVNFQCRGVLLNRIIVGAWPIALALGTRTFFLSSIFVLAKPSDIDKCKLKNEATVSETLALFN